MSKRIFKDNLKYLMKKRGYDARGLAGQLQVTESRVRSWLDGRVYPLMETFADLCDALQCQDQAFRLLKVPHERWKEADKHRQLPTEIACKLKNIIDLASEALEK